MLITAIVVPNAILSSTVDTFLGDLACEDARIAKSYVSCLDANCTSVSYALDVAAESCQASNVGPLKFSTTTLKNQTFGSLFNIQCNNTNEGNAGRYFIVTGSRIPDILPFNTSAVNPATLLSSKTLTGDFSATICKPMFETRKRLVAFNANGTINVAKSELLSGKVTNSTSLSNVAAQDIAAVVKNSIDAAAKALKSYNVNLPTQIGAGAPKIQKASSPLFGFFWDDPVGADYDSFFLLLNATAPQPDPAAFMDRKFLVSTARSAYRLMAAQIAQKYLMTADQTTLPGNLAIFESRLHVRPIGLRLMEAVISLLIILVGLLWYFRPHAVTPRDLSTLGGLAAVLARSPDVNSFFTGMSSLNKQSLRSAVSGHHYRSLIRHDPSGNLMSFGLEHHAFRYGGVRWSVSSLPPIPDQPIWRPFALRWYFLLVILGVPAAGVAALEVVYRKSQRDYGLGFIESEGYVHYAWAFIPAAFMLGLRWLFSMIDFHTRVLAPYAAMKKGPTCAKEGLEVNYLSMLPIAALFKAIRSRHYSVIASSLVMLLVPFMLIVNSALFFPQVARDVSTTIGLLNTVNSSFIEPTTSSDTQVSLLAELVLSSDSYPKWTHNEFVMPALNMSSITVTSKGGAFSLTEPGTMQLRVPVLRANLNCSYVPDVTTVQLKMINVAVPGACSVNGVLANSTQFEFTQPNATYHAFFSDSPFGSGTKSSGCPSKGGVFGKLSTTSTPLSDTPTKADGLHGFFCYPSVSELQADVTVGLPDLSVISVVVDASTAKTVSGSSSTFPISNIFNAFAVDKSSVSVDGFFRAATQNANLMTFLTSSDWPAVNAALERAYRVTFAQRANIVARIPSDNNATPLPATVSYATTNRSRLMQDMPSTRALQGIVGAMLLFSILTVILADTQVVPLPPTSISAMIALLAGSILVSEGTIPNGAEYVHGPLFDGFLFSLGWWVRRADGSKRYGVDVGRPDAYGPDPITRRMVL